MYWAPLSLLALILFLSYEAPRIHTGDEMVSRMVRDGIETGRIHHYVSLNNALDEIERDCENFGENRVHEAMAIFKRIADDFPEYYFDQHAERLHYISKARKSTVFSS
jgi:hypothetical protein